MPALLEEEIRTWLLANVPELSGVTLTLGVRPPVKQSVPVKVATIYTTGGESEELLNLRIITRGADPKEALELALGIYRKFHRLHSTPLTTHRIYMVEAGTRPQQSGREEGGEFLVSTDFRVAFTQL